MWLRKSKWRNAVLDLETAWLQCSKHPPGPQPHTEIKFTKGKDGRCGQGATKHAGTEGLRRSLTPTTVHEPAKKKARLARLQEAWCRPQGPIPYACDDVWWGDGTFHGDGVYREHSAVLIQQGGQPTAASHSIEDGHRSDFNDTTAVVEWQATWIA